MMRKKFPTSSSWKYLFAIVTLLFLTGAPRQSTTAFTGIYFVKPDGDDSLSGTSWGNAFKTLQKALSMAQTGNEIWVASGAYYPDESGSSNTDERTSAFSLKNGVSIYGGFNGTESSLSQRSPQNNITILSGEIQQDDNMENNAYHVVNAAGVNASAVLDGFVIKAGYADGDSNYSLGGAVFILNGSPTLRYLVITQNNADFGGGIYCENGSPSLNEITLSANNAFTAGGGMYSYNNCTPNLSGVTFYNNTASYGGGMENDVNSNAILINVTFSGNTATIEGGAVYNYQSSPAFVNVTLAENSSPAGAGIYNLESNPTLKNVLLAGDCISDDSTVTAAYSLIQDSDNHCNVEDGINGNIIGEDPYLSPLQDNGGFTLTHLPQSLSPVIDSGTNEGCPATDQRGAARPFGLSCDIGSVEVATYRLYLPLLLKTP